LRFTSTPHQHLHRKTAFARIRVDSPTLGDIRGHQALVFWAWRAAIHWLRVFTTAAMKLTCSLLSAHL
jgi:hypothetical protein